jgi:hypothetical protein
MTRPIRAHIFTNVPAASIFKQAPNFAQNIDGVHFTHGLFVPQDIDVLLVYTRASYSIATRLPKDRTIFFAGEPDVIHPYSSKYLNQFGTVRTSSPVELTTEKDWGNMCSPPFVGFNLDDWEQSLPISWFQELPCPSNKDDKISIVTSTKAHTLYHRERLSFIEVLKERIPEHIELYGTGHKSVDDKKDVLLPSKYHLALENGGGPFAWTEKLADPLLCWSLPFYFGANNIHEDLPADCIVPININEPDAAIDLMMKAIKQDLWSKRLAAISEARDLVMTKHNLINVFSELAHHAMQKAPELDPKAPKRLIRSERSFLPEHGGRGGLGQMLLRRTLTAIDPKIELRLAPLQAKLEARRGTRRARKQAKREADSA